MEPFSRTDRHFDHVRPFFLVYFLKSQSYVKISLQISVWKDMSNSYDDIAYVIWTMWYESYHMTKGIIIFINITGGHLYDKNF